MPKEFSRTQRVSELIQRELAYLIQREIGDSHLGLITISMVEISTDLKEARVYITVLGSNTPIEQTMQSLNDAAKLLRHHLSQRLTLRTTPRLQFIYDSSLEQGNRLLALIDSIRSDDHNS
jgi:ribosome-binding factor A